MRKGGGKVAEPIESLARRGSSGVYRRQGQALAPPGEPEQPFILLAGALPYWEHYVEQVRGNGCLSRSDGIALAVLANATLEYHQMQEDIAANGYTAENKMGVNIRPEVKVRDAALTTIGRYLQQFGLTPAARSVVRPTDPAKGYSVGEATGVSVEGGLG